MKKLLLLLVLIFSYVILLASQNSVAYFKNKSFFDSQPGKEDMYMLNLVKNIEPLPGNSKAPYTLRFFVKINENKKPLAFWEKSISDGFFLDGIEIFHEEKNLPGEFIFTINMLEVRKFTSEPIKLYIGCDNAEGGYYYIEEIIVSARPKGDAFLWEVVKTGEVYTLNYGDEEGKNDE